MSKDVWRHVYRNIWVARAEPEVPVSGLKSFKRNHFPKARSWRISYLARLRELCRSCDFKDVDDAMASISAPFELRLCFECRQNWAARAMDLNNNPMVWCGSCVEAGTARSRINCGSQEVSVGDDSDYYST